MDKKNTALGVGFIILAIACYFIIPKPAPRPVPAAAPVPTSAAAGTPAVSVATGAAVNSTFAAVVAENGEAKSETLSNDYIEVAFTDFGGAVRDVSLKKYQAVKGKPEPYVFNQLHADPILAFTQDSFPGLDRSVRYQMVSKTEHEIVFRAVFENRIEVIRRYVIEPSNVDKTKGDPYQLRHETTFRNLTDQTVVLPKAVLSLGTTSLLDANDIGRDMNVGYSTGSDVDRVLTTDLAGGGFLGFGRRDPLPFIERNVSTVWAAAKNQYFASIVTPDEPAVGTITRRVEFQPFPGTTRQNIGITGGIRFDSRSLAPKAETKLGMQLYVGPREYRRLSNADVFKHDQDKVMDYSRGLNKYFLSGYFAPLMNSLINWTASFVGNWGVAIILGTLLIKIISLPFTLSAARSAKRMQKLQPQMQAIKEKYKDNPQKMQQANMELFRENKVNPLGSCLPVLIPMPFFFGFFAMLQAAPELRFSEFLWVKDLASPDTVAHVMGFPINILPLILGVTMIVQTRLVPQPNMDTDQAKMTATMMKWMPLIYVVICYNFSCALSLYSTINGLFTIGQQVYINQKKDEPIVGLPAKKGGRPVKNITPPKRN